MNLDSQIPLHSSKSPEELLQISHENLWKDWNRRSGVFSDARNIWTGVRGSVSAGYYQDLTPVPMYFEYMNGQWPDDAVAQAFIQSDSRAATVQALDAVAQEFNMKLNEIKLNKNKTMAEELFNQVERLIRDGIADNSAPEAAAA